MPTRLVTLPFALGQDEEQARRMLPAGPLREAVNVRQRRGGAFGVRADNPAASMTEMGGTLTPYDLYNLNGRLFALGNRQSVASPTATDIYEYVQQPAGAWKGTLAPGASGTRFPPVVNVRNVGQPPDGVSDVKTARVAAVNGLVCMAYGFGGTAGGSTSYVHIFRANTDSTIVFQPIVASNPRVVAVGNSFWVLGVDAANDLIGFRFDTTVDNDLQASVVLYAGTVTSNIFAACHVLQSAAMQTTFAFFVRDGATTRIRVYNEAGVQQHDWAGPAVAADVLAIESDGFLNETVVVTRVGAADANASRYNTTTHALLNGPTALFGQAVTGDLSITRTGTGANEVQVVTEDDTLLMKRWRGATNPSFSGTVTTVHNYIMGGTGIDTPIGVLQPAISDNGNQLFLYDRLSFTNNYSGATLDTRIGQDGDPGVAVGMGGQVALDFSTGRYFWSRLIQGTDSQRIPVVAEIQLAGTGKRQACQIGNLLFITGAMPLSFDTRQVVESGFTERPVFVSTTPSNLGGGLISGATYDYLAIYRWTDSQNKLTQSALSAIQTVTLGASDNGVTASIYAAHTLRRDANTGSAVTIALYRTDASLIETAASVASLNSIDPPTGVLTGLTLRIASNIGGLDIVTFTAGATTATAILSEINAVTSPDVIATLDGTVLRLTTLDQGTAAAIVVQSSGTANAILGFSTTASTTDSGTATFTRGTIFHLAAIASVPIANEPGQPVSVVDTKTDAALLLSETLYTQGERGALTGILEHEAPPAAQFCASVGSRVFLGGLADRSEVAVSKELFPSEAVAFSSNFSFRSNVDGEVTAVAGIDGIPIAFTADAIFRFNSELPDDNGANGELGAPFRIPAETGCSNPNSIVETSMGLIYQARDNKLMLLPRGGSTPVWIGKQVQDTLALFPVVTGAALVEEDFTVVFTCQNTLGTASTILVLDMRLSGMGRNGFASTWYRDTFASAQVIRAAVRYLGRLAYIDSALVRLQSSSLTPATFIPYNAMTGSLKPFGGNGWGKFVSVTVFGEFRGQAQITCRISYDDGVTFTTMTTFTLNAGFSAGQSFTLQWFPAIRKGDTYVLDFQVLTNGVATEGLILNEYTLEVDGAEPVQRTRTATAQRG